MIRLMYNYYKDKVPARKQEIDFCLNKNLANNHMNMVILESSAKPTYDYFFEKINSLTGPDDINIICNSDIFFDNTIALVNKIKHGEMWALTRWEWQSPNKIKFINRADSQDVWITRGKINNVYGDFTLGIRGCDNRIAHEFQKANYKVSNPSHSVKTYHVHNCGIRNYTMADVVSPPYLIVPPITLP